MKSFREIWFRFSQEAANVALWVLPPRIDLDAPTPLNALPAPEIVAARICVSPLALEILDLAQGFMQHRFPILGVQIETGPDISWRRDYVNGVESSPHYFRRIPYLDADRIGDHKLIWELNRHQHLVVLAQAFLLTGEQSYLQEICTQLDHWNQANPFQCGINWASALEVAFRAFSWMWIYHLVGSRLELSVRRRLLDGLNRHGCHLEHNLSVFFSPNTHLLGEAVVLHALGALLPSFPRSAKWAELGGRIVAEQMDFQVRADGSHFEQSSYYQVYAVDLFLFHALIAGVSQSYLQKLERMAEFLHGLHGPSGKLRFLGDDDGGRVFYPYGERFYFGRATLATCSLFFNRPDWVFDPLDLDIQAAWWCNKIPSPEAPQPDQPRSRLFSSAGLAVLRDRNRFVIIDAGSFGFGGAGHSHSDTLSCIVSVGAQDLLIDPGTYTYVGGPLWRDRFRGSAAHNTVRIDGLDQATPAGPFRWRDTPQVQMLSWYSTSEFDALEATCTYSGFRHSRSVRFLKPDRLWILDQIEKLIPDLVEREIEQFWHAGVSVARVDALTFLLGESATLWLSRGSATDLYEGGESGWRSPAFAYKLPAPVLRVWRRVALPVRLGTVLDLRPAAVRSIPDSESQRFLNELKFDK
jgi:hypothetical protein